MYAALCERRGVTLIEDAAQALGATFEGRALGTFGRAGCFSFDYVKTVTCGEGGAIVTNDDEVARIAEAYTDHGHDHLGTDRGADAHPHLGHNFRLGELNAAVGLAQLGKLDRMLEIQRAHKRTLVEGLSNLPGVRFRELPDDAGDSATFLSVFLPSAAQARTATRELAAAGVDGCFYWYDNNWHYHRQWEHLKALIGPAPLIQSPSNGTSSANGGWAARELPRSDEIMSRTISMLIKLGWSDEQLAERVERMRTVLA